MCHHKAPHRPWQPSPKYKTLFDGKPFRNRTTCWITTKVGPQAMAAVQMKVGENNTKTDLKVEGPRVSKGMPCANGLISSTSRITCAASRASMTTSDECWITWTRRI